MDRMQRILAFILALVLLICIIPIDMTAKVVATSDEATDSVQTDQDQDQSNQDQADQNQEQSVGEEQTATVNEEVAQGQSGVITVTADDARIHRSQNGVKAPALEGSEYKLEINPHNVPYDYNNRGVKPCLYNLRELMTNKIGTSNDKGINRYPYVVIKVNAPAAGYYDLGMKVNMKAEATIDSWAIIVDGVMHVVNLAKPYTTKQTVVAEQVYLTQGEHNILYMAAMPENENEVNSTTSTCYPWANFWAFTFGEGLEVLDASSLTGTDVENIMKQSTRIEAEDTRFVSWNIYSKTETNNSASGKTVVGGPAYAQCKQTFADLTANGLDKAKTPYLQYAVEAPAAGTYYLTVGAYVGTGTNSSKPVPYIAVIANDNAPVKAQFDGAWNKLDCVTVAVQLKQGTNIIRCTSVTPDQYSTGTAWVNQDYIEVQKGLTVKRTNVNVVHDDNADYLYLSRYTDQGTKFGDPSNYADLRWDYPSLYENMTGIYTKKDDGNTRWPYIAFRVNAPKAGEYQISAKIGPDTSATTKTIGMIVDGATHIVDDIASGWVSETVYLSQGEHVIIFTSPIPRDIEQANGYVANDKKRYPWMDFNAFELDGGLSFLGAPTGEDVQTSMQNYSRIEAEDFSYASASGNYNADISKVYDRRSNKTVTVKGAAGAAIDGTVTDAEKKVNNQDSYVQYAVTASKTGTYTIRVGAYLEGSGTMPYGTVLVNGVSYKAQFSGKWNSYDAVNLPVQLQAGKNVIQCIGVTADQTGTNGWIGYDFVDLPSGVTPEGGRKSVSAADSDCADYLYLNEYKDNGSNFGGPNYEHMRYDYPSLYEKMLGVYSAADPGRAGYWPYIAFRVNADEAGYYRIAATIEKNTAKTLGMIVDGATYVVDVTSNEVMKSVYLTKGEHIVIFTAPMPRDMIIAAKQDSTLYPWMNYVSFKVDAGLSFGSKPTAADIQTVMENYTRVEAEDFVCVAANGKYTEETSKTYTRRYGQYVVKVKGQAGTAGDSDYVEYKVYANEAGTYTIRIGAYLEGSGTMPYGTVLVNGVSYKAQFSGSWNGYDAVNLPVELKAGENIIRCIGVTADQTGTNGWIGYDFMDIPTGLRCGDAGEYTDVSVNKGFTFEKRMTYETDGTISQQPYTISAWVYIPSGYMKRGGVIFGNYVDGETPCANFEIGENGVPMFYHINGAGKAVSLSFDKASVCADTWTNITFTISGNNVSCYRNGVLVDTLTAGSDIDLEAVKNQYLLGGDLRPTTYEGSPNVRYFKGRIIDVALFDKALSAQEVASVYKDAEANETKPYTRYKLETAGMGKDVEDVKGDNKLFVKIPYFDKTPASGYAYSFAVVGDTQIVAENDVIKGENNLAKLYDWIVANKDSKNIQYVFGLGDITDNNTPAEWALAKEQIQKLDAAGLAYSVIRGNHDLVGYNDSTKTDYMTQYLGTDAYKSQFTSGGFYDENISNSWRTFKVGNINYLMLALEFGPTDDILNWAGDIIADHPDHSVIITTHAYLYRDGTTLDANDAAPPSGYNKQYGAVNDGCVNDGDDIWEKLVSKHENIVLVLSGHDPSDNIIVSRDKGDNGNMVTSMLIDPQGVDSDDGSTGMLAMLYFSEDGTQIQVEYLSTVRAAEDKPAYFKEVNQFTLELFSEEVSASDKDWEKYLYLNRYADNGTLFGGPNYSDMRWDYPSLYETMTGIYTKAADGTMRWPYIAFQVNAAQAGQYQISAQIGTDKNAKTIGMIVDGVTHIVDVTTKSGWLEETVYLSQGTHIIVFTSPIPRDIEIAKGYVAEDKTRYPYMDFYAFELDKGLNFLEAPTLEAIQASMQNCSRIQAEDVMYDIAYNANYGTYVIKDYDRRYDTQTVIMGAKGAVIDGTVSAEEKKANTSQIFAQLSQGLDATATSYVEYPVKAEKAGTYVIRVGAYVEGSGSLPYGTILVNGKAYKVQFAGNWNGYDAVNIPVELKKGTNIIRCIGVTADQTNSNAWIGYDYLELPKGVTAIASGATLIHAGDEEHVTFNKFKDLGDTLGSADYNDLRWDRLSVDILNYAYLERIPYAAIKVTAEKTGNYDIYFTSNFSTTAASQQIAILVDGVKSYSMTLDEFRSHISINLTKGTHTIVFTTPMPAKEQTAAGTAKFDAKAYPWLDMETIILGKGLKVQKAPYKGSVEKPNVTIEVEEYAMPNLVKITDTGVGSGVYLKAQTAAQILKDGIDPTVTPYVEYHIEVSEAGAYVFYVALKSGTSAAMNASRMRCSFVIENGSSRQVKSVYSHKDTQGVVRVIPVTLNLKKGINVVRMTHFTGDSIQDKGYVWNDFDYIQVSPAAAKELAFLPTGILEAEEASYTSYVEKIGTGYSGDTYLGDAAYGHIDENQITFEALDVEDLGDVPRVTYLFEAEKAGTYTLSVKFNTGLINYKAEDLDKIGFAMIVNGKDKQLVEYSLGTLEASTTRLFQVELVEGENEITFTSTLADYMRAVKPRIEDQYRLVWVDHDALYLSHGLSVGREAEKFGIEDSSVGRGQLKLWGLTEDADDVLDTDGADGIIGTVGIIIGASALVLLILFIIIIILAKKKKKEENEQPE